MKMLIEAGALIDTLDWDGNSPLSLAVHWGHENIVKLLLEVGASVDMSDRDGYSLLFLAAQLGNENIVELLIKAGAPIDELDSNGRSPLFLAAQYGHEIVVSMLLYHGADVNLRDSDSHTVLSWAMECGQSLVVMLLQAREAVIDNVAPFNDSAYASNTVDNDLARQGWPQDDMESVYFAEPDEKINFQLAFTSEVLKVLLLTQIDEEILNSMSLILPDVLKRFALRLGSDCLKRERLQCYVLHLKISKARRCLSRG